MAEHGIIEIRPCCPFTRHTPGNEKDALVWIENETDHMHLAVLQVLLCARRKRPNAAGVSAKLLMDYLQLDDASTLEPVLSYLTQKGLIKGGEQIFMITGTAPSKTLRRRWRKSTTSS